MLHWQYSTCDCMLVTLVASMRRHGIACGQMSSAVSVGQPCQAKDPWLAIGGLSVCARYICDLVQVAIHAIGDRPWTRSAAPSRRLQTGGQVPAGMQFACTALSHMSV